MPNQECNHLTFKSVKIHVFCLHFCAEVVHFVRLQQAEENSLRTCSHFALFYLYLYCQHLLLLVSVISIYHNRIGSRPLGRVRFWSGAETKEDVYSAYRKDVYPHASCSCSFAVHRHDDSAVLAKSLSLLCLSMLNSLIVGARREMRSCGAACLKIRKI